MFFVTL